MKLSRRASGAMAHAWMVSALSSALLSLPAGAARPLTRDDVVVAARARAPDVLRALSRVREAEARALSAEPLASERASLGLAAGPRFSSSLMTDVQVSARLPVPLLVARTQALEAARADVDAAESDARAVALTAVKVALDLYVGVLAARERVELARARATLAEELLSAARSRVDAGDASRLELTLAEAEHAASRAAVLAAEGTLADATGALGFALGMPELRAELVEGALAEQTRAPDVGPLAIDEAVARALVERPDLATASLSLARAAATEEAAAFDWLPDLALGADYAFDGGEHVALLAVDIGLPLYDFGAAQRAEATAARARERQELELLRQAVRVEVTRALAVHEKAAAASRLLDEEAVPRALAAEALVRESYAAGKLDLAALLVVRRDTLAVREEHIERQLEAALAANQLALVVGGEGERADRKSVV